MNNLTEGKSNLYDNPILNYLTYYQSIDNPGYAVLVCGEWGVGKTHQVRRCLEKEDIYYVSLFGKKSRTDVLTELFYEIMLKQKNKNKLINLLAKYSEKYLKKINIIDATISIYINPERTIVFDDIDRALLNIKEIHGIVSHYLHEHNCRVIMIANEKEIDVSYFRQIKEKIIGHTIEIEPEFEQAFDSFLLIIMKEYVRNRKNLVILKIFQNNKNLIIDIFKKNNNFSLRIMKYLMRELFRFLQNINKLELILSNEEKFLQYLIVCYCELYILYIVNELDSEKIWLIPFVQLNSLKLASSSDFRV